MRHAMKLTPTTILSHKKPLKLPKLTVLSLPKLLSQKKLSPSTTIFTHKKPLKLPKMTLFHKWLKPPSELDEDDMELANLLSSPNEQSKENQPPGDHDTPGRGNLRVLACVVVEVTPRIQYRLACKAGVLDHVLCHQDFLYEPNKTPIFYGLQEALLNWRAMRKISVRAGSGAIAPSGGQGHIHCSCSGACDSKRCTYFRAGQKCNSRCHPKNSKCCNKCS